MTANQIVDMIRELEDFISSEDALKFMETPHTLLEGRMPIDCAFEEVMQLVDDKLRCGVFL
jgi:uncharacterized protein (DUF2384 family)